MFSSAFTLSQPIHNLQQQSKNNNCINCLGCSNNNKVYTNCLFLLTHFRFHFVIKTYCEFFFFVCIFILVPFLFFFGFKWIIKPLLVFENKHNPCNKLIYMTHNRSERRNSLKKTEATNKKNKKHNNTVAATIMTMLLSSRSF